jgi:hypothetical protein
MSQIQILMGDERSYIQFAENFIFRMQDLLRKKPDLELEPLIQTCEKVP